MKLSKREKILLLVLFFLGVTYIYYTYLLSPQLENLTTLKIEMEELKSKQDYANIQISPKHKIYKDFKILNAQIDLMTKRLFPEIIQEKIILYIEDMIETSDINVTSISFTEPQFAKPDDESQDEVSDVDPAIQKILNQITGKTIEDENDQSKDSEESSDNSGYNLEYMSASLIIEGEYYNIIKFMERIEYFGKKILVSNLNLTVLEDDILAGNIVLDFYAIPNLDSSDDDYFDWNVENEYGRDNPFNSYKGYTAPKKDTDKKENTKDSALNSNKIYDFIGIMKPFSSDMPSIIIGNAKEKSSDSYLYMDSPKYEDIEFNVFKQNGKYYYRYKTISESYPKNYETDLVQFKPYNNNVTLLLDSELRNDISDVNGMKIKIINETDLSLYVDIKNDDKDRPRINIVKLQGDIKINR